MPVLEYNPLTGRVIRKPNTNANRIRSMSDEELAEFFEDWFSCGIMRHGCFANTKYCSLDCKGSWLDWLKKEAKP